MTKKVELRVSYHPSGNRTLTEKYDDQVKKDCSGDLFVNGDDGGFYRAVAKKIATLAAQGYVIEYEDSES